MGDGVPVDRDAGLARDAVAGQLRVHVRLRDQEMAPGADDLTRLADLVPDLVPFDDNQFAAVHAILDWDHQLPSEYLLLRIYASYDDRTATRVRAQIESRAEAIDRDNLYPEFDLPDYGDIVASESYVGVLSTDTMELEEFRLVSEWRKQVTPTASRKALSAVKGSDSYARVITRRDNDALGGPVVVGWAPPCTAGMASWAVEVWIITSFDGRQGTAHVFMVDPASGDIAREFQTTVQVA